MRIPLGFASGLTEIRRHTRDQENRFDADADGHEVERRV